MLEETFKSLIFKYSNDEFYVDELWHEIENSYNSKTRFYHNFTHLENLLKELVPVKELINDWDTVIFTLFYHDVIYNSELPDNEEKSADFAEIRLNKLGVSSSIVQNCINQILATKQHSPSENVDTNYFTDADLSILGYSWEEYQQYFKNVRKEYSIYSDSEFKYGRTQFLKKFIALDRIYETEHFYRKFEMQAKKNLRKEMEYLA